MLKCILDHAARNNCSPQVMFKRCEKLPQVIMLLRLPRNSDIEQEDCSNGRSPSPLSFLEKQQRKVDPRRNLALAKDSAVQNIFKAAMQWASGHTTGKHEHLGLAENSRSSLWPSPINLPAENLPTIKKSFLKANQMLLWAFGSDQLYGVPGWALAPPLASSSLRGGSSSACALPPTGEIHVGVWAPGCSLAHLWLLKVFGE